MDLGEENKEETKEWSRENKEELSRGRKHREDGCEEVELQIE
jgi:hypothetical protein